MHRLEKIIREAKAEGRTALIPYIPYCYPDRKNFWKHAVSLAQHGADVLEIGVPFSDPVADGPVVESAARKALENGATVKGLLEDLAAHRQEISCGRVLMGYLNPFLQYGMERFASEAAKIGVEGCIIPDLPYEESAPFKSVLEKQGIALIPLVGQNTSLERMRAYAAESQGYCYVVSILGTTGSRDALPAAVQDTLARARKVFSIPLAVGFGLQHPKQLAELSETVRPDAAVFGSSLLRHLANGGSAETFLNIWKG